MSLLAQVGTIASAWGKPATSLVELEKAEREYTAETTLETMRAGQLYLLSLLVYLHDFIRHPKHCPG
ncbi:MAG: hypothetical protein M0Q23_07830 [Syntrophales bacterium]|jgi:hypothetical protein|nr:hypothetical protein [Syntrophales bacterium]MCK9528533.1 hypothetical protein [Syntrophales bacterium]MDX9922840.1 hypothetical protein [Syntrophales bacterium]